MDFETKQQLFQFFEKNSFNAEEEALVVSQATDIISLFGKLLRAYRLYPKHNPVFKKFAEDFFEKVEKVLKTVSIISIRILHNSFIVAEKKIDSSNSDSQTAFQLYNEGLRELFFQRGITKKEIELFFDALSKTVLYANEDFDLTTLLWDLNLQHIGYVTEDEIVEDSLRKTDEENEKYAIFKEKDFISDFSSFKTDASSSLLGSEIFTKEDFLATKEEKVLENPPQKILEQIEEHFKQFSSNDFDVKRFNEIIKRYTDSTVTNNFLKNLSFHLTTKSEEYDFSRLELLDTASMLWEKLILFGAVKGSVLFLKTLIEIANNFKAKQNKKFFLKIKKGVEKLNNEDFLENVFNVAEDFDFLEAESFGEFLSFVPVSKLEFILKHISNISSKELRLLFLKSFAKFVKITPELKKLLENEDWHIVRNTLTILKYKKNNPQIILLIKNMLNHPIKQARIEALGILLNYSLEEALPVFEKSVVGNDKEIRILSIRKLLEFDDAKIKSIINRIFYESNLEKRDVDEISQYFQMIIDLKRSDVYDLIGTLIFAKNKNIRKTAFEYLVKLDNQEPIQRTLLKAVSSEIYYKLDKAEFENFLNLITKDNVVSLLPSFEKLFYTSSTIFSKQKKEIKTAIFLRIISLKENKKVVAWLKKGMEFGTKETSNIIKQYFKGI